MGLIKAIKAFVDEQVSYEHGCEAGEEWAKKGGGPVSDTTLQSIQVQAGYEKDWRAFNRGFVASAGHAEEEE